MGHVTWWTLGVSVLLLAGGVHPTENPALCDIEESLRPDCGFVGIDEEQCTEKGCCWHPTEDENSNVPWCFYPMKEDCGCDPGGAVDDVCLPDGQCTCRPNVGGQKCDRPEEGYYFPTLYQFEAQAEFGHNGTGGELEIHHSQELFPEHSPPGYVSFSAEQPEVVIEYEITLHDRYQLVIHYVNEFPDPIQIRISIDFPSPSDVIEDLGLTWEQDMELPHTTRPTDYVLPDFMSEIYPGNITVTFRTYAEMHLDYLVFLPESYYMETVLNENDFYLCQRRPHTKNFCIEFAFLGMEDYNPVTLDKLNHKTGYDHTNVSFTLPLPTSEDDYYVVLEYYGTGEQGYAITMDITSVEVTIAAQVRFEMPDTCIIGLKCRSVIGGDDNTYHLFREATVKMSGPTEWDEFITGMAFIPAANWTEEFTDPKVICPNVNRKCEPYVFTMPEESGAVVLQAETNCPPADDLPPNVSDREIETCKLDHDQPQVELFSMVSNDGVHKVVVQYFQPYHAALTVDVTIVQRGQETQGSFIAEFCPGVGGCRAVVEADGDVSLSSEESFDVTVHLPAHGSQAVWIDYLIVLHEVWYSEDMLVMYPGSIHEAFIEYCGMVRGIEAFYISPDEEGFCRDAAFSITTAANNGTLPCDCDMSWSDTCEPFGGQCDCLPWYEGRRCDYESNANSQLSSLYIILPLLALGKTIT